MKLKHVSGFVLFLLSAFGIYFFSKPATPQPITSTEPNWMDPWINQEFAFFEKEGITKQKIETTWKKFSKNPCCKRYKVVQSKVYGPDTTIRRLLEVMVQKYPVPDVDFIYYHQDIADHLFHRRWETTFAPIFVSAKNQKTKLGILFVDWYYDIANHHSGWNALIPQMNENQSRWIWDQKIEKLFWRGSTSDGNGTYTSENWTLFPRGRLVFESTRNSDLIDASFTENPRTCEPPLPLGSFVSPIEQLQYKYLIDIDGVTCTYPGFQWRLLSGCLVFKQTMNALMWYHREMTPWVHYIPVHADLRDVLEKIAWAKSHDEAARSIARNGREFALTHLMPEHILLYCYKTLCKYANLQKFRPQVTQEDR